jgi:hypothetical protein
MGKVGVDKKTERYTFHWATHLERAKATGGGLGERRVTRGQRVRF